MVINDFDIKKVSLEYENVENDEIDVSMIGAIVLQSINDVRIYRNWSAEDRQRFDYKLVAAFKLILKPEAKPFFEHIRRRNICAINLFYNDGTEEEFTVPWGDGSEDVNYLQTNYYDEETGNIEIVIEKG